jgi:hypothetical protein
MLADNEKPGFAQDNFPLVPPKIMGATGVVLAMTLAIVILRYGYPEEFDKTINTTLDAMKGMGDHPGDHLGGTIAWIVAGIIISLGLYGVFKLYERHIQGGKEERKENSEISLPENKREAKLSKPLEKSPIECRIEAAFTEDTEKSAEELSTILLEIIDNEKELQTAIAAIENSGKDQIFRTLGGKLVKKLTENQIITLFQIPMGESQDNSNFSRTFVAVSASIWSVALEDKQFDSQLRYYIAEAKTNEQNKQILADLIIELQRRNDPNVDKLIQLIIEEFDPEKVPFKKKKPLNFSGFFTASTALPDKDKEGKSSTDESPPTESGTLWERIALIAGEKVEVPLETKQTESKQLTRADAAARVLATGVIFAGPYSKLDSYIKNTGEQAAKIMADIIMGSLAHAAAAQKIIFEATAKGLPPDTKQERILENNAKLAYNIWNAGSSGCLTNDVSKAETLAQLILEHPDAERFGFTRDDAITLRLLAIFCEHPPIDKTSLEPTQESSFIP